MELNYKLTQYSHGAGCGCKISPATLDKILAGSVIILTPHFLWEMKKEMMLLYWIWVMELR
jgi:selenophosphate synthase